MKAVQVGEYVPVDSLELRDVERPCLREGQILIRVRAVGIGFVDALKVTGRYQTKDPLPFIPGMEVAGVVEETDSEASDFCRGDRVFGSVTDGALAEFCVADSATVRVIPSKLSFEQAAAVPVNYLTAADGLLELADLRCGQNLLVLGAAGGTGVAAIKLGAMQKANVIAGASSVLKRAFARDAGADQAIDYTASGWRDELMRVTGGRPIDVIFDAVGGDVSPTAFRTLGWRGKHLVVGFAAGSIPSLPFNLALLKGANLIGVDSAQIARREPQVYSRLNDLIADKLEDGSLGAPPVCSFPLIRCKDAFAEIQTRRARGKVVVTID